MAETLYSGTYGSCVEKDKIIKCKKRKAGIFDITCLFFCISLKLLFQL